METNEAFSWLGQHYKNVYSQSGEDGLLAAIFERIGTTSKICFEVGASDGLLFSNTRAFLDKGWKALLIEKDRELYGRLNENVCRYGPNAILENAEVDVTGQYGMDHFLGKHFGEGSEIDLGVIDIDGQDYYVWNAMLRFRPRVLMIEYSRKDPAFTPTLLGEGQAGVDAIVKLGIGKCYHPIFQTDYNMIFVDQALLPLLDGGAAAPVATSPQVSDIPVYRPAKRGPVRLNLGAGDTPIPGYINVDRKTGEEVYPLTGYVDRTIDEVRASHVLEHFGHREVESVLKEWTRVLKFGGTLKIAVPDLDWIARNYLEGKDCNLQGYLMGGHADANDRHGCAFDAELLTAMLKRLGYRNIRPWQSEIEDCARLPVSLNLQAEKWYRVKPVMSVPRLGFMDNFFAWAEAMTPLGLLPTRYAGALWGQCLERVMEKEEDGADLLLTIDYDTPIRRADIERLIKLMHENPKADAIAALQMGRDRNSPLVTVNDADGKAQGRIAMGEFYQSLMPAATAHFGCTILRTRALKKMPHPWFLGVPNEQGRWGEGRTDDDIYFWRQWAKAGNTLFIAPEVVVGHGEYMFSFPDQDLNPIHQHPQEFFEKGPPAGAFKPSFQEVR